MDLYERVKIYTEEALKVNQDFNDVCTAGDFMDFAFFELGTPLFFKPKDYWKSVDLYCSTLDQLYILDKERDTCFNKNYFV
jgi:hypothetical protein